MKNQGLDITQIQEFQRNRYPYLLIDRVTEFEPGKYAKGYKNFTMNEWFFPAHYAGDPIVPGMLQIESLVQIFIMTFLTLPEYKGMITNFIGANNVKFYRRIVPGDRLNIEANLLSIRRGIAKGNAVAHIDDELTCKADFVITIPEILQKYAPNANK